MLYILLYSLLYVQERTYTHTNQVQCCLISVVRQVLITLTTLADFQI